MQPVNPVAARAALANLPLTQNLRLYADYWLSTLEGGEPFDTAVVDQIMDNVVHFEVRPRRRAIWLRAGRVVNDGLGVNLAGQDYTGMVQGADRSTRLARMTVIASGCIGLHSRWITNTQGRLHFLKELALPCGAGPNGTPRMMTYVDSETASNVGRVQADKGALALAASFEVHPIN